MKMRVLGVALAGAAFAISAPVDAQTIDYTLSGAGSGTMSLDYNGSAYSFDSLNLTLGTATFTQASLFGGGPSYCLSADPTFPTMCASTSGVDSFWLGYFNPSLASQTTQTSYGNSGDSTLHDGWITINRVAAVPEPATWAMMLLGFGAIAFAMRGRKRITALAL